MDPGLSHTLTDDAQAGGELDELPPGTVVGRFVVERRLGAGAFGTVYAARDPELERSVALKVLHPKGSSAALRERLRREARALARLSHPHLLAVYDVGDFQDTVFLALELVSGVTLRQHLLARRSWAELRPLFLQAGSALAAAHRAGLVHRDVKPDNVLVDAQGAAHLADLGLAAADAGTETVGTRGYVAPEVTRGQGATPASDQYSFCATLYEALGGKRLDGRLDLRGLRKLEAPAHVRRALFRGLSDEPRRRFPTMDELLRALGPKAVRRRRRVLVLAITLVGAGLAAIALVAQRAAVRKECDEAAHGLGDAWSAERRQAASRAFTQARPETGAVLFERAAAVLDAYAQSWASARRTACRLHRVEGAEPAGVHARRQSCLAEAQAMHQLLARRLGEGQPAFLDRATYAAHGLPSLERCLGSPAQLGDVEVPGAQADAARSHLYEARVLYALGQTEEGLVRAADAATTANQAGLSTLEAEALALRGFLEADAGRLDEAEKSLFRALLAAQAASSDGWVVRVLSRLVYVTGYLRARFDEARRWGELARATLRRMDPSPMLEGQLENDVGLLALAEWRLADAEVHFRRALTLKEASLPAAHPDRGMVLNNLGLVVRNQGRAREAATLLDEAARLREETYGPAHRTYVSALSLAGAARADAGLFTAGLRDTARAVELGRRHLGRASLGAFLQREASVRRRRGECTAPEALLRESLAVRTETLGPSHAEVAEGLLNLGLLQLSCGRPELASPTLDEALAIQVKSRGQTHPATAYARALSARALVELGRTEQARAAMTGALELLATPAVDQAVGTELRLAAGAVELARGRLAEAEKAFAEARARTDDDSEAGLRAALGLAQAVAAPKPKLAKELLEALVEQTQGGEELLGRAEAQLELARLLALEPEGHARAKALASAALETLAPLEQGPRVRRRFLALEQRLFPGGRR